MLTERGIFRDLYRDDRPVVVDPVLLGEGITTPARSRSPCAPGDEVLGSIWAAMDGPLTPERAAPCGMPRSSSRCTCCACGPAPTCSAASRTELVSTALEGGAGRRRRARPASGWSASASSSWPLARAEPQADQSAAPERRSSAGWTRFADALAVHLSAVDAGSAVALVGDIAYGPLPVHGAGPDPSSGPSRSAEDFLERVGHADAGRGGHRRVGVRRRRHRPRPARPRRPRPCACRPPTATAQRASRACPTCSTSRSSSSSATWPPLAARGRWARSPACWRTTSSNDSSSAERSQAWLEALRRRRAPPPPRTSSTPTPSATGCAGSRRSADSTSTDPDARFAAMLQLRMLTPPR